MSKLGHLIGIKGIRPGRSLEIYPYGSSGFSETSETPKIGETDVGFDMRYGVTSDVTLDLTVNPDFAQVEADVLQINLTRYPTRFPEKRKFFLEGRGIFQTPLELFYSRRIGANSDILWGTKVTGRTKKSGLEYGFLASQTGDWNYFGLNNKNYDKERALYGIARIRKGFSNGSSIGMIVTDKEVKNGDYGRIFGIDGSLLFKDVYKANFQLSTSRNTGLLDDSNYYSFGIFRFAIPWTFRITSQRIEPDFNINSTGIMNKELHRGSQNFRTVVSYNPYIEKKGIRQINVFSSWIIGEDIFTGNYVNNWKENNPNIFIEPRYLNGNLCPNYYVFDQSYSIRTTNEMNIGFWYGIGKTNELSETYHARNQGFNISSPMTGKIQKLRAHLNYNWGTFYNFAQKYLGSRRNAGWNGTSWVRSNLGLELSGNYTETFDPEGVMDGKHFRLSMRNTYLFTKDLFIRLYTQGRWGTTYYGEKDIVNKYLASFLLGWEFKPGSWFY
ncbi:hypothetical protein KAS50_06800, partial [bacterium]|nr:hypothetical protein [bacterium]